MNRLTDAHTQHLAQAWSRLRLAVDAPDRFPSWDAVVLTASGPAQAAVYERLLGSARARGVLPARTRALVVPDPEGPSIGSGGATLNALRVAAAQGIPLESSRVLMIHAGGDGRRVPWAGLSGKVFLPLPLLADPDHEVPALFDHLVALSVSFATGLPRGGMLVLAGDVLPLFDTARVRPTDDGARVITTPAPLDMAGRHGVVVADAAGRVTRLLQKASPAELAQAGALIEGGSALLDTGLWLFAGRAWRGLVAAAAVRPGALDRMIEAGAACSLYEDLAAALVPSGREALARHAWGRPLAAALEGAALSHHRADEMVFLHFGTTAEILEHLSRPWFGRIERRLLAEDGAEVARSTVLVETALHHDAQCGGGGLLCACRFGAGAAIGRRCVAVGVDDGGEAPVLPDHTCLWEVPVAGGHGVVYACCGVDDDPGAPAGEATFCNRDLRVWMTEHGVAEEDLWPGDAPRLVWHARLFPVQPVPASLRPALWLAGRGDGPGADRQRAAWRAAMRVSLADLPGRAAGGETLRRRDALRAELVLRELGRSTAGALDRNVYELARQLRGEGLQRRAVSLADRGEGPESAPAARSRRLQMQADLLAAGGERAEAERTAARAFEAVQDEVARAVRYEAPAPVSDRPPARIEVELPVRFDISGGWSDTPPYCLERPAMVLNLAMTLDGARPVRVEAETLPEPAWDLAMEDLGAHRVFRDPAEALGTAGFGDPFMLVKTALRVTGFGTAEALTQGVRLRTRAAVPKGSGLGTSSILGAAVIQALQRLAGRPDDTRTVSDLVLVLEQQMRTGGGWQDQVGGLVPGVKCIRTAPERPLRMRIDPVPLLPEVADALERRMVILFTGQQRLARNILQRVVERYLRRDARTLSAIGALVELAEDARAALAMGRLDDLGAILASVWQAQQQLTPECSNPPLDAIFRAFDGPALGGKLAGAGGGGFMGVMARDEEAAAEIRRRAAALGGDVRVYEWRLWRE